MSRNLEEVKKELQTYIIETEAIMNLWKQVKRKTKKDGTDFAVFSKNFENATYGPDIVGNMAVKVHGYAGCYRYVEDEIGIRVVARYENTIKPDESRIINEPCLMPYFYLTVDEVFIKIAEKIKSCEDRIAEYRRQLEQAEEVFNAFQSAIQTALDGVKEKAGKTGHLYHACRDYMQYVY